MCVLTLRGTTISIQGDTLEGSRGGRHALIWILRCLLQQLAGGRMEGAQEGTKWDQLGSC